jgi:ABC-type polysaccharide/polyol phosphate transport system ATPase subunit
MTNAAQQQTEPAIVFRDVWKYFHHHAGQSLLRTYLAQVFSGKSPDRFAALRGVNFTVEPGEGLAIVGANGAGKSTLLSLVAGLCRPEQGEVLVRGRVGALLELGTGFHPDLTGRENLHLNAAFLGYTKEETERQEQAIVDFADIGDFIDEPLRSFSSGMALRRAFSIAIHGSPDILIVDEVLAVGDREFQRKCFSKILEIRDRGCTFLFVSHSSEVVKRFCRKAIWLEHGELRLAGEVAEVIAAYEDGKGVLPPEAKTE